MNRFFSPLHAAIWIILLATAAALRLWQLPGQLLADDEWHAIHKLMGSGPGEIFQSFGHADHTIPLTLFYQLLAQTVGLTEWVMRAPMLIAGVATVLLLPWLLGSRAFRDEKIVFGALLAVAPLLVYFSRTARPYALSVVLAVTAIFAFRWWWLQTGHRWAIVYVACTAIAAWLHPLTLAVTGVGFLFHAPGALLAATKASDWSGIRRLTGLGVITLLALAALLGPPIVGDFQSLATKAGADQISPTTVWAALQLFSGSGNPLWTSGWILLTIWGGAMLVYRDPATGAYLLTIILIASALIAATGGAWIHHPLVLARYLLPVLPIMLFLSAIPLAAAIRTLPTPAKAAAPFAVVLMAYLAGPLPGQYHQWPNQFTGHMAYQFDYDTQRNVYNQQLARDFIPDFYQDLSAYPARSITLIKAPWYMEWHWNPWHLYQAVHKQSVVAGMISGLCLDHAFGEIPPSESGIRMMNKVHLNQPAQAREKADFLVVRHSPPRSDARPIPDWDDCRQSIDDKYGPPIRATDDKSVYSLSEVL